MYQRGLYLDERTKMMQLWANLLDELAKPECNVTPLRASA